MRSRVSIGINGTEQTIDKGVYDPRTMVSLYKLSEEGLVGLIDENPNDKDIECADYIYRERENER